MTRVRPVPAPILSAADKARRACWKVTGRSHATQPRPEYKFLRVRLAGNRGRNQECDVMVYRLRHVPE